MAHHQTVVPEMFKTLDKSAMYVGASALPFRFLAQPLFLFFLPVVSSVPETEHGCSKNFEKRRSDLNAPKFLRVEGERQTQTADLQTVR